jgi:hypothetical protein
MRTWTSLRGRAVLLALAIALGWSAAARAEAEHRFGVGQLYWRALDDIADEGLDQDGTASFLTYQYAPEGIFRLELDVEYYAQGFGGSESAAYSPVAFVLVEFGLYVGLGVGVTISDGLSDDISHPFYAARVGWDFQLIPRLHLDVNANYRADTFEAIKTFRDYDRDSITLGAAVRLEF